MSSPTGSFKLVFEGVRGETSFGDIAIDDIALYEGICADVGTCDFEHVCKAYILTWGLVILHLSRLWRLVKVDILSTSMAAQFMHNL